MLITQPCFVYPGGAGGHWILHLIQCLHVNFEFPGPLGQPNYHNVRRSRLVKSTHFPTGANNEYLLSTTYSFNLWLNGFIKAEIHAPGYKQLSAIEKLENLSDQAKCKFDKHWVNTYETDIDLRYEWLFKNPDMFLEKLFAILDTHNIFNHKNLDLAHLKIQEFCNLCPPVEEHVDNFDSVYWTAWCCGILKKLEQFDVDFRDPIAIKDRLIADRNLFLDFSDTRIMY